MESPLQSLLAKCMALLYRALSGTWRVRFVGRDVLEHALAEGPVVLAIWHGEQAALLHAHRHMGVVGLASQSRDGALLAGIISRLGYGVIRGSSSRGAVGAVRASLRAIEAGRSPALAVDGPRGPRHVPQLGGLHLAARSGRPVVYMVGCASSAFRLKTWDRFVLPLPFARIVIGYGAMKPPAKQKTAVAAAAVELGDRMAALSAQLSLQSSGQSSAHALVG